MARPAKQYGDAVKIATDSLAFALDGAARALTLVSAGTSLPSALNTTFDSLRAPPSARGAIQDISYRSMRSWGLSSELMDLLLDAPPQQERLGSLLRISLGLLADASQPYAEHTVVDQAVSACAADRELSRAKGVVNAVLRRFLRERDRMLRTANASEEAQWNYPQWWIDKLRNDWPNQWEDILQSGNARPPLTLRVNRRLGGVEDYLEILTQQQIEATPIGPWAVRLTQPTPVSDIPGFLQGRVSVQDAAAQLAAPLMQLEKGMRVLDACAAPGGKSVHLLETEDVSLVALDNDKLRLSRVADNLDRLGFKAELLCGDARRKDWWDGQGFDRILADVPCTASGIVRRHPDIRWLRRPEDARTLAKLSSAILDNLWSMLRPGGLMLFVTCSIWPEESELQAEAFCQRHSCERLPAPGQLAPKSVGADDHDGLFYALLQKPSF